MLVFFSFNNQGQEPNDTTRFVFERHLKGAGIKVLKGEGAYRTRSGNYNREVSYCAKVTNQSQLEVITSMCRSARQESILIVKSMADQHGNTVDTATFYYLERRQFVDVGQFVQVPYNHALQDENGFSSFNGKHYVIRQGA